MVAYCLIKKVWRRVTPGFFCSSTMSLKTQALAFHYLPINWRLKVAVSAPGWSYPHTCILRRKEVQDDKEVFLFIREEILSQELSNRHFFTFHWPEQDHMHIFRPIPGKGGKLTLPNLDYFILYYQGSSIHYQNRPLVKGGGEEERPGGHMQWLPHCLQPLPTTAVCCLKNSKRKRSHPSHRQPDPSEKEVKRPDFTGLVSSLISLIKRVMPSTLEGMCMGRRPRRFPVLLGY